MKTYRSFIVVDANVARRLQTISYPSAWKLSFNDEPSKRFWQSPDGLALTTLYEGQDRNIVNEIQSKELIIDADSEEIAGNINNLLYATSLLAYPDKYEIEPTTVIEVNEASKIDYQTHSFGKMFKFYRYLYPAVISTIAAWGSDSLVYAIEKYGLSLELDSFTPHSADPVRGQIFDNYINSYSYHVKASYAIISAFSIIEELGLEVRSSATNPRFNNGKTGWNPQVYDNLDKRLIEVGLTASRTYQWIERGVETDVQKDIKPKFGTLIYPGNPVVRDVDIELAEAIHRCSYIRNFIAAHKFNKLTAFLSPYDVFNVQMVARLLLLHKLGSWNTMMSWRDEIKLK